jgi:LemA protein
MTAAAWVGVALVLLLVAGVVSYNRFVRQRQHVRDSFSNIDTELRRRYDLIPNLVETVRGYQVHERQVLEAVVQARARAVADEGSPAHQARTEAELVTSLRQLFAVAEGYPELKASQNFLSLQEELAITEDRIQAARRFYNANVREFNRRIHAFPSNLIASKFGFTDEEFFEIDPAVRASSEATPEVSLPVQEETMLPPAEIPPPSN